MKDLSTLSDQEFQDFLNSFDVILSDVDGVLWNFIDSIPGAVDGIISLQKLNKKIIFVSNNTTKTLDYFSKQFKDAGFDVDPHNIVTPTLAMISFLKKQNLTNKKIFVLGTTPVKEQLIFAGFQLAEDGCCRTIETARDFVKTTTADDPAVGAVLADGDFNLNSVMLQKGTTYLERPEVLFLKGATDLKVPGGLNKVLIGPGHYHKIMEYMTNRKAVPMAKPSEYLSDYIIEKYEISDKSRVLVIGDSIPEDMAFGAIGGYQKLLVLSGLTKKKDLIEDWTYSDNFKPDFYADSLKVVYDLIIRVYLK